MSISFLNKNIRMEEMAWYNSFGKHHWDGIPFFICNSPLWQPSLLLSAPLKFVSEWFKICWLPRIDYYEFTTIFGSYVLKASAVVCRLIPSNHPWLTLNQYSIDIPSTPQLTLDWHSIDISFERRPNFWSIHTSQSTLGHLLIKCW